MPDTIRHLYDTACSRHTEPTSSPRMTSSDRGHISSPSRLSYYTTATADARTAGVSSPRYQIEASDNSPIKADRPVDHDPSSSTWAASSSRTNTAKEQSKNERRATAKRPREQYSCVECCECLRSSLLSEVALRVLCFAKADHTQTATRVAYLIFDIQSDESKSAIGGSPAPIASSVDFRNDVFHPRLHEPTPVHLHPPTAVPFRTETAFLVLLRIFTPPLQAPRTRQ